MGTIHRPGTHWNLLLLSSTLQSAIHHNMHHGRYLQNIQYNTIQYATIKSLVSRTVVNYLVESEARDFQGPDENQTQLPRRFSCPEERPLLIGRGNSAGFGFDQSCHHIAARTPCDQQTCHGGRCRPTPRKLLACN